MAAAILGLGIIGAQWAKHLNSDGQLAACWNRTAKPEIPKFTDQLDSIPQKAELLHFCLADPPAVKNTLEIILPKVGSKHLVVQSSTIDPKSSEEFKKMVEGQGAAYVEAPFTGSLPAAEKRELIFYIGGHSSAIARAQPYLAKLSKKVIVIGNERQAATIKLAMNLQIASAMEAMSEALSIARSSGITDETFYDAFKLNASYSGLAALKEPKLRNKDYSPQFSIKHMAKDLRLLRQEFSGSHAPFLETLQHVFSSAQEAGLSDEDFSALIKLINI